MLRYFELFYLRARRRVHSQKKVIRFFTLFNILISAFVMISDLVFNVPSQICRHCSRFYPALCGTCF